MAMADAEARPSIHESFTCDPDCPYCGGDGVVCENHPLQPWRETAGGCMCGAGMPCRPEAREAPEPDG